LVLVIDIRCHVSANKMAIRVKLADSVNFVDEKRFQKVIRNFSLLQKS